ncbi:anthranilate phosphoribosyltransferase [Bacillus canaveralius]|uniref:Anthranilate phosphoribosyltransferase n=1 Tax=Bacillus canaveralius TaxID=1403243 RepID=A0A2N5GIP5_9BACI|nr:MULTISPECIES: anthranilate phosphoribosyltransferase [Bacillus]PLR80887.1 anthranilate phosphoribosyltransferase [Bacillus canaveralius]PLR83387.1 anthranilate phosphoribosyltransferase [Bacillus sp. V33-4]PLR91175.1 anthranilate phosphoribosyltransferase [Bacillus canaveralius]RSK51747.1 anthranilate phosphoribosyltransferase [Bacillus canaveralius]
MRTYLQRLSERDSLTEAEMKEAALQLLSDDITDSEIAAFLISLKTKGETVDEIVGLVQALRDASLPFQKKFNDVLDNCGTGGDGSKSFNISTTSAFVIAGAGITVAKHGNRSVSSKTGSADVLEQLGVNLASSVEATEEMLEKIGIAFLFAPNVHPRIKQIMKVRKDLRIPTVFNLIGPLTNPVNLDYQLLGTYRRDFSEMFANVLKKLGRKRAVVVSGAGHMDEASLQGENHLVILDAGEIKKQVLLPEEAGLSQYDNQEIKGGDSRENAEILQAVLKGKTGAYRDTVLLNAGIGIYAGGKAASIKKGIELATESIDSGAALDKLEQLIEKTRFYQQEVI